MSLMRERMTEAINAKNNDITSFVWKFQRKANGIQDEIKLIDATPEQLNTFYKHCNSMLYNRDAQNPGRYVLLNILKDQRQRCNAEIFLRKLESGSISVDGEPYPRFVYMQNLRAFLNENRAEFPSNQLKEIPISACTSGLPREFQNIPIEDIIDGCLGNLGTLNNKHITFSFILNLGVCLSPEEMPDFIETNEDGIRRKVPEVIKERLGLKPNITLMIKPSGLDFNELRSMLHLKSKKYSDLTSDQLVTLRNKVLFRLEEEVLKHIETWEDRIRQIKLVAKEKGINLSEK